MHAQLARPPLFKVTVQGLGTLSSGTPAPGLPMRLCGSTLILIKPHFSGRESRVGGGVVERGARRSGINTHFNEGRTWAQVARLGRWHLTPSGSWATPLLLRVTACLRLLELKVGDVGDVAKAILLSSQC
ncbi:unnamed protein product [Leuciscus chuanchicus]